MGQAKFSSSIHSMWAIGRLAIVAAVTLLGACSALKVPTEQSIQGLTPSGTVSVTEDFLAGYGGGTGRLTFNGQTYPFRLIGTVLGPGGADRITASGEVYKLNAVNDFAGRYTQGNGAAGLSRSGNGQLWLQNSAGVIMHLYSTSNGVLLSLGKEEILIRLEGQNGG